MASVDIVGLRKTYGSVVALEEINIKIASGSFFTLLGPSGCGKTTLLRTIAGFHAQNSGQIIVDGNAIEHIPAHKRNVGMVFQDYAVFPHLSVFENVAFGLKQRKVNKKEIALRVGKALDLVHLGEFTQRMPHELSGGQQQRVGLARALVINPTVLLMDEPLSNLDAKLRVDLRHQIKQIQQERGITTVYVTHDQEEALAMSDIVCVMYQGIIQQAADPLTIYNQPNNKFVATFVGANNFFATDISDGLLAIKCSTSACAIKPPKIVPKVGIVAAVRPEHLSVSLQEISDGDNIMSLEARVKQVSFIGRELEVIVENNNDEEVKVVTKPTEVLLAAVPGQAMWLSFDVSDVSLFENSETGGRIL